MAVKKINKGKFRKKLIAKYRLVILNEDTFEEKLSFKLTRLNVFVAGTVFSIILIFCTTYIIAFTSLREYIPGYSSTKLKRDASNLIYQADSLQQVLDINSLYILKIQQLLTGKIDEIKLDKDSILKSFQYNKDTFNLDPSAFDLEFRQEIERADRFSLFNEATREADIVFFAPVKGTISDGYNVKLKHFAVDIATSMGAPVKSVADGTVIFAEWTAGTGYVIIVEHSRGFISIYKHNKALHKNQGDVVQTGEVIASAGNSGEYTTGPHLHFELWSDGNPVNPINFIDFN
ncbi:M23 family metallopeptidase [Lutibacter sp.]|uniref:M23 family metallopeptidase n=1 Tax=Lutibacter sp. TaxID=1925666 RepID=UPI002734AC4F|nr:M23 family metallopeptidase [Lutibacter sp.]MDP3314286.1 M23 family metallopeptidase [Lutibacter sp.]